MVKTVIQIGVDEHGAVHVAAPIHDEIMCLGLLEKAKQMIHASNDKKLAKANGSETKIDVVGALPNLKTTHD